MTFVQRSALMMMVQAVLNVSHIDPVTEFKARRLLWKLAPYGVYA
ncbi:hypothetical protein [Methylobacterium sp. WL120]|nr:hypothetical protein [Methylobacterium sp. WL120]